MAIGYDGGAYSGNLDEISLALGVDPDIEGVTSRKGTPVDKVLGLDDFLRDLMSFRTYQAGKGLLGQGDMEDPLLQQISLTGNEQGDTIHLGMRMGETYDDFLERTMAQDDFEKTLESITPTISKSLVKDAQDKLSKIYDKDYTVDAIRDRIQGATTDAVRSLIDPEEYDAILPETPPGTTDIFNAKTGMWEAVYDQLDRPSETSFVDTQVTDIGDDILSGTQSFEVETPSGTTDIFDTETGEWTALTDTEKLMRGLDDEEVTVTELPWVDDEDELTAQKELDELIALNPTGRFRSTIGPDNTSAIRRAEEMSGLTMGAAYPSIDTTAQDTQANVMDEGYLAGLNMTAEESHAITRALNLANANKVAAEYEAWKQGGLPLEQEEESSNLIDQMKQQETSDLYNTGYLEGLSQAMKNVLENDPELMAQYMAARSSIIGQLEKTGYKEHEEFYPGSQAAATQAGFWGPMALGWNDKYNEYKDAQRELMGLQSGQRFMSGDWINNLGWMTPAQINQVTGYGEP